MKKLSTKARQAVTTKRGRAQAVRRAIANQKPTANGVRVRVSGMQGPKDYSRMRDIGQKLTPEESAKLLSLLKKAKVAHQRSLNDSLDDGLKVLPRLIRPAARKILFGR